MLPRISDRALKSIARFLEVRFIWRRELREPAFWSSGSPSHAKEAPCRIVSWYYLARAKIFLSSPCELAISRRL